MEKLNLTHHFNTVTAHFSDKILPTIRVLSICEPEANCKAAAYTKEEEEEYLQMIGNIVEQASAHPLEVRANISVIVLQLK